MSEQFVFTQSSSVINTQNLLSNEVIYFKIFDLNKPKTSICFRMSRSIFVTTAIFVVESDRVASLYLKILGLDTLGKIGVLGILSRRKRKISIPFGRDIPDS